MHLRATHRAVHFQVVIFRCTGTISMHVFTVAAFTMEDRFVGLEEIVVLVTGKVGFLSFLTVFL